MKPEMIAKAVVLLALGGIGGYLARGGSEPLPVKQPEPVAAEVPAKPPQAEPAGLLAGLAAIHAQYGDYAKAAGLYASAISSEQNNNLKANYLCSSGEVLLKLNQSDNAKAAFEKAVALAEDAKGKSRMYYRFAAAWKDSGDLTRARESLAGALENTAEDDKAFARMVLRVLVQIYRDSGELDKLVRDYEERVRRNPADELALQVLETVFWEISRDGKRAAPVFLQLAELTADQREKAQNYYQAARAFAAAKEAEKGIGPLEKAIKLANDVESLCLYHLMLGELHAGLEQYAQAREDYQFVVDKSPSQADRDHAADRLFDVYRREGKLDAVIAEYRRRVATNPNEIGSLRRLGMLCWGLERKPEIATEAYEKILTLIPADRESIEKLAEINEVGGKYEKSAGYCEKLVQTLGGSQPLLYEKLAKLYAKLNRKDVALQWAERIVKEQGDNAGAYPTLRLADIKVEIGALEDVDKLYAQAVELARNPMEAEQVRLRAAMGLAAAKMPEKQEDLLRQVIRQAMSKSGVSQAKRMLVELYKSQNRLDQLKLE
jgi:tetratricopeptide (TPR) repeat protein